MPNLDNIFEIIDDFKVNKSSLEDCVLRLGEIQIKRDLKIEIEVYDAFPCRTERFKINGKVANQEWFVENYDNGDGDEIEYGCNNRVTDYLDISQVRDELPEDLQDLTAEEIYKIQDELSSNLISGGCGWCV